jgi:hypothetical protein
MSLKDTISMEKEF